MTQSLVVTQQPFKFTVLGTIDSAGEVVADLSTVAAGSLAIANNLSELTATKDTALGNLGGTAAGIAVFQASDAAAQRTALGATATGDALFTAVSASAARTTLAVTLASLSVACNVAATTANALYVAVPTGITGTVSKIRAVTNGDPGGTLTFVSSIGTSGGAYSAITNGGFTVANGATAGTASIATPTAANAVTGGTSIVKIAWDNGAASAVIVGVVVEITRA